MKTKTLFSIINKRIKEFKNKLRLNQDTRDTVELVVLVFACAAVTIGVTSLALIAFLVTRTWFWLMVIAIILFCSLL